MLKFGQGFFFSVEALIVIGNQSYYNLPEDANFSRHRDVELFQLGKVFHGTVVYINKLQNFCRILKISLFCTKEKIVQFNGRPIW